MRQLLAAAALVAAVGLPTTYFLGAFEPSATIALAPAEPVGDAADAVIDTMREVAAGLEKSLQHDRSNGASIVLAKDTGAGAMAESVDASLTATGGEANGLTGLGSKADPGARTAQVRPAPAEEIVAVAVATPELSTEDVAPIAIAAAPAAAVPAVRYPRFAAAGGQPGQSGALVSRDYPTSFFWFDLV